MKASLQLKHSQQLTMTPQLQQAIRLLQLSTLDLQTEIQEALDSNPLLENDENDFSIDDNNASENNITDENITASQESPEETFSADNSFEENYSAEETAPSDDSSSQLDQQLNQEQMPDDLPTDSDWEDTYQASAGVSNTSSHSGDGDFDFESRNGTTDGLIEHVLWQLNLTPMSETDKEIAIALIDGLNDDGYLTVTIEDVLNSLDEELEVEEDEIMAVLHRMQQFEPAGVFAKDLQECLLIQLKQLPEETPWLQEAMRVIGDFIEQLGSKDYVHIQRKAKLKEDELRNVLRLIQELTPKPGAKITPQQEEYVIPDIIVRKATEGWKVDLNPDISPKLRVNDEYASLVKRADNSADNTYIKDHLQEARWFIKSLQSRNDTLLKVARKIVEYQYDFFEQGEEGMKPLVLHDIAEAVGMHESTISRATTQKYMHTPRGLFELKYFFSSHVSTTTGGECSSTAIRAMIKKLIADESAKKPLSDNKLATMLADKGIKVARRTVAKYREAMHIPPSNERKRLL